jgi:hypothetical protein
MVPVNELPTYYASAWFWALGSGIQGVGAGNDNGALYGSTDGYGSGHGFFNVASEYGYGYVTAHWANGAVDGCIDDPVFPTSCSVAGCCTAILVSDELEGEGYFAFLTSSADIASNYRDFGHVNLSAIPSPDIVSAVPNLSEGHWDVVVNGPALESLSPGLSLDGKACILGPVKG